MSRWGEVLLMVAIALVLALILLLAGVPGQASSSGVGTDAIMLDAGFRRALVALGVILMVAGVVMLLHRARRR